jgi:diguanylate cyclase (GGDEF)-like protein/PAS domain S-box-containing protein
MADMEPDLMDEYEGLMQFLYIAPIGLAQAKADGEVLIVNPVCASLLMPLSRTGAIDNLFEALEPLLPDLRQRLAAFTASSGVVCEGLPLVIGSNGKAKGTTPVPEVLSLTVMKLEGGRLMVVLADITATVKRENELRQNQAWINSITAGLSDYLITTLDARGCIDRWNPGIKRLVGWREVDAVGRHLGDLFEPDSLPPHAIADRLREADANGWSLDEGWMLRKDGRRFWGSCLIAPLDLPADTPEIERGYSLIVRDFSDRRESMQSLLDAVERDQLTGAFNRRAFFGAAQRELQKRVHKRRPMSLLMVDADHFKQINDRHGHPAGDAVLRHLAAGLNAAMRAGDVVARMGGEEFAVLLPGTDLDGAEALAERVRSLFAAQSTTVGLSTIACTVSIGVAELDAGEREIDALIERADRAMYRAKHEGRNRVASQRASSPTAA